MKRQPRPSGCGDTRASQVTQQMTPLLKRERGISPSLVRLAALMSPDRPLVRLPYNLATSRDRVATEGYRIRPSSKFFPISLAGEELAEVAKEIKALRFQ